jgi:hypothetical protein
MTNLMLHAPAIITARLLPGVKVGDTTISIKIDGQESDGRTRYRYYIDGPNWSYSNDDIRSGCQGGSLQEGLSSLLSFLAAFAEAVWYKERTGGYSENAQLFPKRLQSWAVENSDELSMLSIELEETPGLIQKGTS